MRFDLADLQLFVCIVDAGSITHGATKANIALSSASERLRYMEEDIGIPLLLRHARGVTPTEAGEVLLRHARQIIHQQQILKNELKTFALGMRGTLRLYANTSALTEFLPKKISPWLQQHPDIHVELEERSSTEIIRCITMGLGEAGIVSDAVYAQSLITEPMMSDHLVLIVPLHHPLYQQDHIYFSEVIHQAFVGFYAGSALQTHINAHAHAQGCELNIRIRMNTFEGMCEMVEKSIGIAILPEIIADKYQHKFAYKKIQLQDNWALRQLCLCYRVWEELSPAMKNLLNYLKH